MTWRAGVLAVALVCAATAARAEVSACDAAISRIDTFGERRWVETVHEFPAGVDCSWHCAIVDRFGVQYEILDGYIIDKQLPAGTKTRWPWRLKTTDGPAEVKAKLARIVSGEGTMSVREGGPTYNLEIPGCHVWIEVTFAGDRGIKAVSLNVQP